MKQISLAVIALLGQASTVQINGIPNSPYKDPAYSPKFDGAGHYSPRFVEDFTDSSKFDSGVGGGIDQDNQPLRSSLAQSYGIPNSPYKDPAYSPKFDGAGHYSPRFVEDFTDSSKFDNGVGGGIDQDNQPLKGLLAQKNKHVRNHDHMQDYLPMNAPLYRTRMELSQRGDVWKPVDVNKKRRITDLDGDGVEDNVKLTHDQLDRYWIPNRMVNVSDDVYNTQHGNYPGHERLEEYPHPPKDKPLYSRKELGVVTQGGHTYDAVSPWYSAP